jgi:hypothetical protein
VLAPVGGERGLAGAVQALLAEVQRALARHVQPAQDVQQRRLAAARGAEQHDEFTAAHVQVDVVQRAHRDLAGAVGLGEGAGAEERLVIGGGHGLVCRGRGGGMA